MTVDTCERPATPTWTPSPGKALVLRTCETKDGGTLKGARNFTWPSEIGAVVEAPDWDPRPQCGNGLHGLLWGTGNPSYLNRNVPAYMVVEVDAADVIWISDDKVKFPRCTIVYVGDLAGAATLISEHAPESSWMHDTARALSGWGHRTFVVDMQHRSECPEGCDAEYDECAHVAPTECIAVPVGPVANIVSSELTQESAEQAGMWFDIEPGQAVHTIALDIDHRVEVRQSSTEGHYHLYIDVAMPWWKYRRLLRALRNAGVIEPGYYSAAVHRKATFLRLPWIRKPSAAELSEVES